MKNSWHSENSKRCLGAQDRWRHIYEACWYNNNTTPIKLKKDRKCHKRSYFKEVTILTSRYSILLRSFHTSCVVNDSINHLMCLKFAVSIVNPIITPRDANFGITLSYNHFIKRLETWKDFILRTQYMYLSASRVAIKEVNKSTIPKSHNELLKHVGLLVELEGSSLAKIMFRTLLNSILLARATIIW